MTRFGRALVGAGVVVMQASAATAEGKPIDGDTFAISPYGYHQPVGVASGSAGYALLFHRDDSLSLAFVPPSGAATDDELELDGNVEYHMRDIAIVGTRAMAVWSARTGYSDVFGQETEVHGAVVDMTSQTLVKAVDVSVNPNPMVPGGNRSGSRIAADGSQFAVLFHACDGSGCAGHVLQRFDTNGNFLGQTTIGGSGEADISFDGSAFVVARSPTGTQVEARRFGAGGQPLGPPISLQPSALDIHSVQACAGPNEALVVWSEEVSTGARVMARRVGPAGAVDPSPIVVVDAGEDDRDAACSFDGTHYVIAWRRGYYAIHQASLSATASLGSVTQVTSGSFYAPSLAHQSSQGLIVWGTPSSYVYYKPIRAASLASGGALGTPYTLLVGPANAQRSPAAAGPGPHLAAWVDDRTLFAEIYLRAVDAGGTPLGVAKPVAASGGWVQHPSVAFDGSGYLVIWRQHIGEAITIRGALVDAAFDIEAPFEIAATSGWGPTAAVHDGSSFVVAWADSTDVVATRVSSAGLLLDNMPFAVASGLTFNAQKLAMAADAGTTLVAWKQDDSLRAARLSGGQLLDTGGFEVAAGSWLKHYPSAHALGSSFVVTWADRRNHPSKETLYGARIDAQGTLLDPGGIPLTDEGPISTPAVAPALMAPSSGATSSCRAVRTPSSAVRSTRSLRSPRA